jgi:hypothetical protein
MANGHPISGGRSNARVEGDADDARDYIDSMEQHLTGDGQGIGAQRIGMPGRKRFVVQDHTLGEYMSARFPRL